MHSPPPPHWCSIKSEAPDRQTLLPVWRIAGSAHPKNRLRQGTFHSHSSVPVGRSEKAKGFSKEDPSIFQFGPLGVLQTNNSIGRRLLVGKAQFAHKFQKRRADFIRELQGKPAERRRGRSKSDPFLLAEPRAFPRGASQNGSFASRPRETFSRTQESISSSEQPNKLEKRGWTRRPRRSILTLF